MDKGRRGDPAARPFSAPGQKMLFGGLRLRWFPNAVAQACISQVMPRRGPFLLESHHDMKRYRTGDTVPETGIYRVIHNLHRLCHEAVLAKDEKFPRCAKCTSEVLFELAYEAPDLFHRLQHRVYELPVIEDEATANSA